MLILLLATCEAALERFGRADVRVEPGLLTALEQVIAGTQAELEALDR